MRHIHLYEVYVYLVAFPQSERHYYISPTKLTVLKIDDVHTHVCKYEHPLHLH